MRNTQEDPIPKDRNAAPIIKKDRTWRESAWRTSEFRRIGPDFNLRFGGNTSTERINFPEADFWSLEVLASEERCDGPAKARTKWLVLSS